MRNNKIKTYEKLYHDARKNATLYKCEPVDWLWIPKPLRTVIAMITLTLFACCFLVIPFSCIFLIPAVWRYAPICSTIYVCSVVLSMILPIREWIWARQSFRLETELRSEGRGAVEGLGEAPEGGKILTSKSRPNADLLERMDLS